MQDAISQVHGDQHAVRRSREIYMRDTISQVHGDQHATQRSWEIEMGEIAFFGRWRETLAMRSRPSTLCAGCLIYLRPPC